jgi:ABC-type nitrate/sulfonate/bicarbonate transport system substrate-binding protein
MNIFHDIVVRTVRTLLLSATIAAATISSVHAETVRVAMLAPSALLWLHAIAEEEGFYASRDLQVEVLRAQSSPALLQAVSSNSVEAGISLGDLVIRAIDKGAPIVITGAVLEKTILRMVAVEGIDSPAGLAGKNVTAGAVTGGTANMMLYQLKQAGVDTSGVKMVAIPNSRDRIVALANGQVDGALLIAPFDALATREGMNLLADFTEPYLQTPLIINKNWAAEHPEAAADLTQAMQEAANWINDPANKGEAIRILTEFTKAEPEIAAASYEFIVEQQKAIGANFEMPEASLQNIENINAELEGRTPQQLRISDYYDRSYLAD